MALWPASLPAPALNSLTESPPNNLIRSNTDKGPDKVRRRTTADTRPLTFSLNLTAAQVTILDTFYTVTLYGGADEFDYTHPRTRAGVKARFTQPPQWSDREGAIYNATIALEILP